VTETTDPTPGPSSRLPRPIWVLAGTNFVVAVGFGVMSPVLPAFVRLFGVSSFLVGLVVSSLAIVRLVANPAAGRLLRLLGPRGLLILGDALIATTTFLMGVSNSYGSLLLWRGLSGLGSACFGVSSLALDFALTPAHQRGRANAVTGGGWVVGGMAGPALGGLVAQISLHAPFFFYAATLAGAGIIVALAIPPGRHEGPAKPAGPPLGQFLRDRRYRAALAVSFANSWQSFGVRNLLIPLVVVEQLGRTPAATGWAFTVAAIAQTICLPVAGWSTDRVGRKPTLLAGLLIMAAASPALAASHHYGLLIAVMCLYSVGASATGSAGQALLADTVPPSAGPALAAYQMAGDAGTIAGPLVAGALIDVVPMPVAWSVGSVFFLVAATLTAAIRPPDR
jgi:MFS family permease